MRRKGWKAEYARVWVSFEDRLTRVQLLLLSSDEMVDQRRWKLIQNIFLLGPHSFSASRNTFFEMSAVNLAAPILSMYHRLWLVICSCLWPLEWTPGQGLLCTANMFPWQGADCTSYSWKSQENCLDWKWWVSLLCIHVFGLYSFFMYLFYIWSKHLCGARVPVC